MEKINMMPVEVHFKPYGTHWIAVCPALDIATQGETFARANENMAEALLLFFDSCLKRGTLETVLSNAGYSKVEVDAVTETAKAYLADSSRADGNECRV